MGSIKKVISVILLLFLLSLLVLYWFIPHDNLTFGPDYNTSNFSVNNTPNNFSTNGSTMQFYPNLRYAENKITYSIINCPNEKYDEMIEAMGMLSAKTILNFISVSSNPEIEITCERKVVESENGFFIAGEGGPTNITLLKDYSLITHGKVLLLRTSQCSTPDIALHELLHALGFVHSPNPKNIMYPVSNCRQELSKDITDTINKIYMVESLPDLSIEKANADMKNHYLNLNVTVKNIGFKPANDFIVNVYVNGKLKEEIKGEAIEAGFGRTTMLSNIFITSLSVNEIKLEIVYNSAELQKDNNILVLE